MRLFKPVIFVVIFAIVSVISANAQVLERVSFVFDRYNGYDSTVLLSGYDINVTAKFRSNTAPMLCAPCTSNSLVHFGPVLDPQGIISASGTLNGTFYPQLYILTSLFYSTSQGSKIPKFWTKTVRVSAAGVLTGTVGIWTKPENVGNNALALYRNDHINFAGTGKLTLRWNLNSGGNRLYTDKYLSLDFAVVYLP